MTSKRESILEYAKDALAGIPNLGTRIFRSRIEAFQRSEAPAVVVEPGNDMALNPSASNCYIDWELVLLVAVYTRGHQPETLADPIISDIHARLMANRSMGGLTMDIWPDTVEPSFEKADRPALWTICSYKVRYRTSVTDLSTV